jgi:hypothetical protein
MTRAIQTSVVLLLSLLYGCGNYDSLKCGLGVTGPQCPQVARAPCTGFSWIVKAVHCQDTILRDSCVGITDLVLDPSASPPQARMRVGEATLLELSHINPAPPDGDCSFNPGGFFPWVSSNPAVARTERTTINTSVVIRGVAPGDADIFADGVNTPGGAIRAPLAYCPDSRQGASCSPTPLVLRVVR